jgi:TetR/AcrR family transcriptional repressor of nem operon
LLDAAAMLIHDRGYSAVSVSDICAEAGLKKGSFYHFFPSKRDLVLAAIDKYAAAQAESFSQMIDPELGAIEQLNKMFTVHADGLCERHAAEGSIRGCPLGNLALEMAHRDPAIREKLASCFAQWRAGVAVVLRRGIQRGELDIDDPDAVAESLVAYLEGAILLAKATNDPKVLQRVARGAESIVLGAA